ncbi:MFS transporter [Nonomuraea sp. NPDC050556]|uniref:MFS transporter n=1 Tax=Nonomuraea sp. NPDC050556 TaxID=3364369 RepID=UPI0037AEE57F
MTTGTRNMAPLLGAMFATNLAAYVAFVGAAQILLPAQVQALDPQGKVAALGLVTGVAAIASVAVPPVVGALSDRTSSRYGRRSPWILYGGAASLAALAFTGVASSIPALLVAYFLVSATVNVVLNTLYAVLADRVPASRLGLASTVAGLGLPIGGLVGVVMAGALVGAIPVAYLITGALVLLASIPLAITAREQRPPAAPARGHLGALPAAFRSRDFTWVFASRSVLFLGYYCVVNFTLYILTDYIVLPAGLTPVEATTTLGVISLLCLTAGTAVAGPLADRLDRRRLFVLISSLLTTASVALPLLSPTWTVELVAGVVGGLGFGAYLAVDQALATLVLPASGAAGRDLGIFHIALNAPQVVGPLIGSAAIGVGGYRALFVIGGVLALLGSVAILQVKSVR